MNAVTAFDHRKEALLEQLTGAQSMEQAILACTMALEQTACELAQNEQDECCRQRQQAVLAIARRAPQLLRAAAARGELVLEEEGEAQTGIKQRMPHIVQAAGAFLLAALAVHELVDGKAAFAAMQLVGGALLILGGMKRGGMPRGCRARGVATLNAQEAVRLLGELCQAADTCVSDLALIDRDAGMARLSGTADDAMLDLLGAMMEAKASGRDELAMRSLAQAEQYLHMLGIEIVAYDAQHQAMFDLLPTLGEARTIRPALIKDGKLLRRGAAACSMERSVQA